MRLLKKAAHGKITALRLFYRFMARAIRVRGPLPL
nr:MAG TPA: hypothetical protein [Caudoviricetes sp.]